MIPFLRQASSSIFMRLLLALVVVAVVLTMGISSFFSSNPAKRSVAKVGSYHVTAIEFLQDLEQKKQHLKQYFGRALTQEEAMALGLVNKSVSELITKALITQEADRLGIAASDDMISKSINNSPKFKDQTGKFNRERLTGYLAQTHQSEHQYLKDLNEQMSRGMLASAIDSQVTRVPKAFLTPMYRHINEMHDIEIFTINVDSLPTTAAPEDAKLKEFYTKHASYFYAPETRSFKVLFLNFQDVAQSISVTTEELQMLYKQSDNKQPEKRSFRFVPLASREDAMKAKEELSSGAPFEDVYSRYTGDRRENAPQPTSITIKDNIQKSVVSEIFALKRIKDVSDPLFLGGQYFVFILEGIEPEKHLTFDEQKFALLKQHKTDLAREKMYDIIQRTEKMLNTGTKLEEVVDSLQKESVPGVAMLHWDNVAQDGKTLDGTPAVGLSGLDSKVLSTAFDTPQFTYSDAQKLATNDYIFLEVTDVKAPHQRTFEDSRQQAINLWQLEQKRTAAQEHLTALKTALANKSDLGTVASNHFAKITVLNQVSRSKLPKDALFMGITQKVTTNKTQAFVTDTSADRLQLARIIKTYPADEKGLDNNTASFAKEFVTPLLRQDLLSSYIAALEEYYPVTKNETYFETHFRKEDLNDTKRTPTPDF